MATKIKPGYIDDNAVGTAQIADNSITAAKIAAGVLTDQIAGISSSADSTAITIDSSENVGIGTTNPSAPLHIVGDGNTGQRVHVGTSSAHQIYLGNTGGVSSVGTLSSHNFQLITNGASRLVVDTSGKTHIQEIAALNASLEIGNGDEKQIFDGGEETIEFQTADTERLRISGNNLHLNGGTDARIQLGTGGAGANQVSNNTVHVRGDGTSMKLMTAASGNYIFENNGTERMRITAAGLIGMGNTPSNLTSDIVTITTPASGGGQGIAFKRLDSNTDQVCGQIRWSNNSTDDLAFIRAKTDGSVTNSALTFHTNTGSGIAERMRINSTGNVLLGDGANESISYTSANKLIMHHGHAFGNIGLSISCGAFTGNYDIMRFYNGNGQVGDIRTSGSATDFDTSSDYRLKENVSYDWDATTRLKQLKPARFNWIADETNTPIDGFLAHEVSDIVPNAINGEKDAVYTAQDEANGLGKEGEPNIQGIDHSKLVPLLTKAIQELEARIKVLEG